MESIFLQAYAEGIIESLKAREGGDTFAGFDLGEEMYEDNRYLVPVKFWWEGVVSTGRFGGIGAQRTTTDRSVQTVLRLDILSSRVTVGYDTEWYVLNFGNIDASADWLAQEAVR